MEAKRHREASRAPGADALSSTADPLMGTPGPTTDDGAVSENLVGAKIQETRPPGNRPLCGLSEKLSGTYHGNAPAKAPSTSGTVPGFTGRLYLSLPPCQGYKDILVIVD